MVRGWHMSAAARAAQSARMKGKKHAHKGHAMSAAARAKISRKLKGKKHPHKGHSMSADTRAKISEALKRHYASKGSPAKTHVSSATGGRHTMKTPSARLHGTPKPGSRAPRLSRSNRTHKFHSGTYRLISSHPRRKRTGLLHGVRRHHSRIKVRKTVRHHRVWRKRRKR